MFDKKEPQAGEWIEVQAHGQTVLIRGGGSELRAEVARLKEALKESAGQSSIRDEVIKKQAAQIQWINTKRAEAEKEIDRLAWELSKVSAWHANIACNGRFASGDEGSMKARGDLRRARDIISGVLQAL